MAEKKKMSVADILAAARKRDAKARRLPSRGQLEHRNQPAEAAAPEAVAAAGEASQARGAESPPAEQPLLAARHERGRYVGRGARRESRRRAGGREARRAEAGSRQTGRCCCKARRQAGRGQSLRQPAAAQPPRRKTPAASWPKPAIRHKPGPMSKAEAALKAPAAKPAAKEKPRAVVPPMPAKPDMPSRSRRRSNRADAARFLGRRDAGLVPGHWASRRWPRRSDCGRWAPRGSCSPTC